MGGKVREGRGGLRRKGAHKEDLRGSVGHGDWGELGTNADGDGQHRQPWVGHFDQNLRLEMPPTEGWKLK